MLDWMFMMFVLMAIIFLLLSIFIPEDKYEEPYWKIMFCTISGIIWFILGRANLDIYTPYTVYNSTTGNTTMWYSLYISETNVYLTYFYAMMGVLCFIYIIILIFGYYYEKIDEKNKKKWDESE